jgi:hypothetical protein
MSWPGKMASGTWYLSTRSSTIRGRRSAGHDAPVRSRISLARRVNGVAGRPGWRGSLCRLHRQHLFRLAEQPDHPQGGRGPGDRPRPAAGGATTLPVAADRRHHRGQRRHHPAVRQRRPRHALRRLPVGAAGQNAALRPSRCPGNGGSCRSTRRPKAAQRLCDTLPLFDFTMPGQVPPTPPVLPGTLADYAYNHGDPSAHADCDPLPRLRQPGHPRGAGPCQ